jgi:hypothetical protein
MIMEAKQTKVNDLWTRTLTIFNCVHRPARPLRLTSTAASSTIKYSSPVIALGPSDWPGLTTTPAPGCVPSLQPAGPPLLLCFEKSVNLGSGTWSQMCFHERRARILFMFDVDLSKRSANALWVTLPFV